MLSQEDTIAFSSEKKYLHLNNLKVCNKINKINSTDTGTLTKQQAEFMKAVYIGGALATTRK